MRLPPTTRLIPYLSALAMAVGAVGCAQERPGGGPDAAVSHRLGLAQLPDCDEADVGSDYSAGPADVDGFYIVSDGDRAVCATDFDGLQTLAQRFENGPLWGSNPAAAEPMPGRGNDPAAAEPMPGRGNDPAAAEPMPGRGNDPAAAEPMPGRGNDPAAAEPMPGRGNTARRLMRTVATR